MNVWQKTGIVQIKGTKRNGPNTAKGAGKDGALETRRNRNRAVRTVD
jgi:hypothetical protein